MGRNAQVRRFRRDLRKKLDAGPSGESNPFGNRAQRRSKAGKLQTALKLEQLRAMGKEPNETV